MKKLFNGRKGMAFTLLLLSAGFTLVFGAGFSLLTKNFWGSCKAFFEIFFAFPIVSAALLLFTNIEEDLTYPFGAGLYYGTGAVCWLVDEFGWGIPIEGKILLGLIISGLVCYIVYLRMQQRR